MKPEIHPIQLTKLQPEIDKLQFVYGCPNLKPIYGAGCLNKPNLAFVFMNPTGKNISSSPEWNGLRAPWIGTKSVWKILYELGFLSNTNYKSILTLHPNEWTNDFANKVYREIAKNKVYITNLAKCTQNDARQLVNSVFKAYLKNTRKEISLIKPKKIILFGNQVSSIMLSKPIKVSDYKGIKSELLKIGKTIFRTYPTHYPVGQGQRNMSLAIKRIEKVLLN